MSSMSLGWFFDFPFMFLSRQKGILQNGNVVGLNDSSSFLSSATSIQRLQSFTQSWESHYCRAHRAIWIKGNCCHCCTRSLAFAEQNLHAQRTFASTIECSQQCTWDVCQQKARSPKNCTRKSWTGNWREWQLVKLASRPPRHLIWLSGASCCHMLHQPSAALIVRVLTSPPPPRRITTKQARKECERNSKNNKRVRKTDAIKCRSNRNNWNHWTG